MYRTHFSNDESCINQPHHSDNDDDIPSNERYHQVDQSTLCRCQQTNRPYVPENGSLDESDSCKFSTDLNADTSSDQCDFDITSSLSDEDCYGDESNEGYDDYSSEEQSMFLCKKCRKTCGLHPRNDENSSQNSIHQRDESNCPCQHEIPEEACRGTQNSHMDETSQFELHEASSPEPRLSELSSDEFERKYIDGPECENSDSKYLPDYHSEYPGGKYDESSQYDQSSGETDDDFKMCNSGHKRRHRRNEQEINESSSSDDYTFNE